MARANKGNQMQIQEPAMTTFDKRERGFEKLFAQEAELMFKASARRNRLVGLWAAEKLGFSARDAEAYATSLVIADLDQPGSDSVFKKLRSDFKIKGVGQSDHQIRRTLDEFMKQAVAEMKAG
jgi:hypothetical protein